MASKEIPAIDWIGTVGLRRALFGDRRENIVLAARATQAISQIVVAGAPRIVINSPDYAHELLVAKAASFHSGKPKEGINQRMFGNGLFIREGESHRQSRKEISPVFERSHLATYAREMADCALAAQSRWAEGDIINIKREMDRLMFDILGRTFFSKDLLGADREVGERLSKMTSAAFGEMPSAFRIWLAGFTGRNQALIDTIEDTGQLIMELIEERRADAGDRDDLLAVLMKSRDENKELLNDQDLHDALMGLISGAYATTANALIWMWCLLALHPDVQGKMQAEIDSTLGGNMPTFDDLSNLPYTLQVFKEAQRLFPFGSTISRRAIADVEVDGYTIPKGALVWVSTYEMHRNPSVFPDPEIFRPERFDLDAERKMPRNSFMTFSIGPRLCIGRHFAQLAGQITGIVIAQQVSLLSTAGKTSSLASGGTLLHTGANFSVKRRNVQRSGAAATA